MNITTNKQRYFYARPTIVGVCLLFMGALLSCSDDSSGGDSSSGGGGGKNSIHCDTITTTVTPEDKTALITEINRAIAAGGPEVDLNYIDTSKISTMKKLFKVRQHSTVR